jgi:hypothetical protein
MRAGCDRASEITCSQTDEEGQYPMSIREVSAEQLAELLHHYHQALTPDFAGAGNGASQAWNEVPQQEKKLMVAAAQMALLEIDAAAGERGASRGYFAMPGEAEWGC